MNVDRNVLEFCASHLRSESLSQLRDTVVVVEAEHFLSRMSHGYVCPFKEIHVEVATVNEPLMAVMGGPPTTLRAALKTELDNFTAAGIRPLVVFPGMEPKGTTSVQDLIVRDVAAVAGERREAAWKALDDVKPDYLEIFRQVPGLGLQSEAVMAHAMRYVRQLGCEVMRAPFASQAQMAYFLKVHATHSAFGSPEMLLYEPCQRVIVEIDFKAGRFYFLERQEMWMSFLSRGSHCYSNFLDTVLLVTNLAWSSQGTAAVHDASTALAKCNGSIYDVINQQVPNVQDSQESMKWHLRARALYRHGIILNQDCCCVPITDREDMSEVHVPIPQNLAELWGDRVSDLLYYLHSVGAMGTSLLTDLSQNCFRDHCPVVDTTEYREMLEKVVPLRTQVMFQIINALSCDPSSHFHQRAKMTWYRWFHHRETTVLWPPQITLGEWDVQNHVGPVDFQAVFKYGDKARKASHRQYQCLNDVVIAVHMKALDLLGYFTHSTLQSLEETSGLSVYSEALREVASEHQEVGVLLIEMLRTRSLRGGEPYTVPTPAHATPTAIATRGVKNGMMNLICRVWCLITPKLHPTMAWGEGASKDLGAFLSIVKALSRTLRSLAETLCANLFLTGSVAMERFSTNAVQLSELLPFSRDPAAYMGIVMEHILRVDECDVTIPLVQKRFPCCIDLDNDLRRGFEFWAQVLTMMTVLEQPEKDNDTPIACSELLSLFHNADVFVQRRRMLLFP